MTNNWGAVSRQLRMRHGLSQARLAAATGLSRSTIVRCERGEATLTHVQAEQLQNLRLEPPAWMFDLLLAEMRRCPAPRALSRMPHLKLIALSGPALQKRPSMSDWIGRNLDRIASGVLEEMLDDRGLQRGIARREIVSVVSTTTSVLQTPESPQIGVFRTTSTYFLHEGAIYSDAISVPVSAEERCGYTPIGVDEMGEDLFGDHDALEAVVTGSPPGRPYGGGSSKQLSRRRNMRSGKG